jgi:hypothetical protein
MLSAWLSGTVVVVIFGVLSGSLMQAVATVADRWF